MQFFEKLAEIENKYEDLNAQLSDARLLSDQALYQKTAKASSELREVVEKYREWKEIDRSLNETRVLLEDSSSDPDLAALAREELGSLEKRKEETEGHLKILLLPKDPNDEKNIVMEIRAGTGGDEATLFAQEIFRMYSRFAEEQRGEIFHPVHEPEPVEFLIDGKDVVPEGFSQLLHAGTGADQFLVDEEIGPAQLEKECNPEC